MNRRFSFSAEKCWFTSRLFIKYTNTLMGYNEQTQLSCGTSHLWTVRYSYLFYSVVLTGSLKDYNSLNFIIKAQNLETGHPLSYHPQQRGPGGILQCISCRMQGCAPHQLSLSCPALVPQRGSMTMGFSPPSVRGCTGALWTDRQSLTTHMQLKNTTSSLNMFKGFETLLSDVFSAEGDYFRTAEITEESQLAQ